MPSKSVLVTGGAGFVGSHLVDALLDRGHRVRVLDSLEPQVHGAGRTPPAYLSTRAELVVGDVRDLETVRSALRDIDTVYHLAAAVGVAQSMYRVADYVAANTMGTANLLQALVDERGAVERVVVASSMSIYGEGRYVDDGGAPVEVAQRGVDQLRDRRWDPTGPDGRALVPRPTDEAKPLDPTSIYALTKADQERMVLQVCGAYGIPAVALRFFNIYGPRQALSNPYTGAAAIFASRLLNGEPPLVFEDGQQRRDFVSVHDIVQSLLLAAESSAAVGRAINVGSGRPASIREVAETLAAGLGVAIAPQITGTARLGDIRHCYADISLARELLGYEPRVRFEDGMAELVGWLGDQERPEDGVAAHAADLAARGLAV